MISADKQVEFVSAIEEDDVSRDMLSWLNTFPDIPISIVRLDYEYLSSEKVCMALSLVQSTYVVERFINGSYTAEYQFKIVYRAKPDTPDARLKMDQLLNDLGTWASGQAPAIGEGLEIQELEQTTRASLFARMENGWEDHQIFMRMTYHVKPKHNFWQKLLNQSLMKSKS